MSQYIAKITLYIDPFQASTHSEADQVIDEYISLIANAGGEIFWNEVDYEVEEYNDKESV